VVPGAGTRAVMAHGEEHINDRTMAGGRALYLSSYAYVITVLGMGDSVQTGCGGGGRFQYERFIT